MNFSGLQIMGVLNITTDSFSDGGKYNSPQKALKRAIEMQKQGATIIDIGAEASGPGSKNVSAKKELQLLIPTLKLLKQHLTIPVSIDTYKASVALKCLENGANIINDITGLRGDKKLAKVIAKFGCPISIMHSKDSTARTTIKKKIYKSVTTQTVQFLEKQINYALLQGIKRSQIIIDPGMGHFISSTPDYSYELLLKLHELKKLKAPILIGLSRKSFLGGELSKRDELGKLPSAIAYLNGARIIRTHDVQGLKSFFEQIGIN